MGRSWPTTGNPDPNNCRVPNTTTSAAASHTIQRVDGAGPTAIPAVTSGAVGLPAAASRVGVGDRIGGHPVAFVMRATEVGGLQAVRDGPSHIGVQPGAAA